jgi:hypothetical protein
MNRPALPAPLCLAPLLIVLIGGCEPDAPELIGPEGTPELREALFDSILAMTARREAFSQIKHLNLDYHPLQEMEKLRGEVVSANSEEGLFYALAKLSNARRDRHLSLGLVPAGILPPFTDGLESWGGDPPPPPRMAPVKVRPDFGSHEPSFFIAEVARPGAAPTALAAGDRLVTVNGLSVEDLEAALTPHVRHSTVAGLRWKLAELITQRSALLPPSFLRETLDLEVEKADGSRSEAALPYLSSEELDWSGLSEPAYAGFALEWSSPTFDLYLPQEGQRAIVLQWHRFESSSLMEDVGRLVALGEERGLLDHAILFDATRSGGGSLGAYAIQRIQPLPFKTTFGTVRVSDVVEPFVQQKREDFAASRVFDSGGPETVDDGTWLMDWLEMDLIDALERGDSVTVPVPFKLAHAPKDSDGILQPAPLHFRGPLVVFSGPNGGSHLDQFMSIVADNQLGRILGMPAGGYSNTWEWEEVLYFPGTEQPVVGFMWSIGHTIRPNGEVLEGNPAPVDDWIPLTAENSSRYYEILMARAFEHLEAMGFRVMAP